MRTAVIAAHQRLLLVADVEQPAWARELDGEDVDASVTVVCGATKRGQER